VPATGVIPNGFLAAAACLSAGVVFAAVGYALDDSDLRAVAARLTRRPRS
jgi:hypothetical protein